MYLTNKLLDALPKRVVAAIVDLCSLALASAFVSIVEESISAPQERNKDAVYTAIICFSLFLNKDMYFGQSIGKYFIRARVVSVRTGNAAGPVQCAIRNLFILIWPVEAIILLFSPGRRLGDLVAGTRVQQHAESGPETKWQYGQAILSVVASFTLVYLLFTFIDGLGIMS